MYTKLNRPYKFNVGDKVIINDCSDNVEEMRARVGTIATITKQTSGNWGGTLYNAYFIYEDNTVWYWREDWLSPEPEIEVTEEEVFNILLE